MARWGVVGGGVLGCSMALRLAGQGHQVTLYESAAELGGLAAAWQLPGPDGTTLTWDRHYHVTLLSDARTRAMLASIGLDKELKWVETRTGYYGPDGNLVSVSNSLEFLKLPGLNLLDKARLAGTILGGSRIRDGHRMERVAVGRWLRRWSGRRTYDRFWVPLLRAKLGDAHDKASAAFIWATIQRLYAARRSGLKKEMFGYVPGGYDRIMTRFAETLGAAGVRIELGAPVSAVRMREGGGLTIERAGRAEHVDDVVVTLAAPLAAAICPDLSAAERGRLEAVHYQGIVCASVLLDRPLGGYYLTYITDPSTPFTAVVEMTAFVDPAELAGKTLVYLPKYVAADDPLLGADDATIRASFLPYLRTMYPDLRDDDVISFQVSRVRRVFAVPTLRYSDTMPSIATSVPGLRLAGSANLPFATSNVDDTLSLVDVVVPVDAARGG
jgi:protoporphyrinogen oxidase